MEDGAGPGRSAIVPAGGQVELLHVALAASETRYRVVVDQLRVGVVLRGPELEVLTCNAAAARILGLSVEELMTDRAMPPTLPALHEDGTPWPADEHPSPVAMRSGRPQVDQIMGIRKRDGTVAWLNISAQPLCHAGDERPYAVLGTFEDITERKQAEDALRQAEGLLALSFDRSPLGMTLTTLAGRALRVNRAFAEMIGVSVDELLAMPDPARLTHPDDQVLDERHLRALRNREVEVARWEKRYLHADGHAVWAGVSASILRAADGSAHHVVRQVEDITERKHREAEEQVLRHIAEIVARGAGSGAVLRAVAARVRKLLDARSVAVTQRDPQTGRYVVLSASGSDAAAPGAVLPEGEDEAVGGQAMAPIFVNGELWGMIRAGFGAQPAALGSAARLERVAQAITGAIINAQAWDTLSQQATTDALTGLANSRTFHDRLRSESQRARRYGRDLSVVLFDVDHFKRVNDTYGHQVGDDVLTEVARRLGEEAREGELLARIGGEEFAWLIPEAGPRRAYLAADRVRRAIESRPFSVVGGLTVSAGVCSSAERHEAEDLVRFADHALYWAKDGGRNTTFVYTDEARAVLAHAGPRANALQTMSGVCALARAIDAKDVCTARHSERVANLAEHLALKHGWSPARARQLHACGLLHDVGKIGIPDSILLKPGR
jgi:diguanylate cyclase (GGDEF)-like protein/PAS domain S-box-containing protein